MFASGSRAPFTSTSFGFGAANQAPFGSAPQMFPSGSTFGANASTGAFGQTATPMFGAPQQSTSLFGATPAPVFGQTANQNAFGGGGGSNIFGQQSQPQANPGLFGATNTSFGQPQNKPNGFSFTTPQPSSIFGQPQATQPQTNLFQPSGTSNIFGSAGGFGGAVQGQTGTQIKFVPVTGTDSMQKSGTSQMINTKHHSITCMKEYEAKSFEELRYEDYVDNRKGPQQQTGFAGSQPFGAQPVAATPLFGQTDKPAFGAATNTFGQPSTFGFGNQPAANQSPFGKSTFGTSITTSSFGFPSTATPTNIFGSTAAPKPFGTQATPLFGTAQQPATSSFGTSTSFFGQPATAQTNFFNKSAQPAFPAPQTSTFSFGQNAAQPNSLFQTSKPNTGFNLFGQSTTATTAFGQPTAQTTGFGGGFNAFGAKPAQTTFGQPAAQTGFGSTLPQSNIFGGLGAKPAFGTNTGGSLFGTSSLQPTNNNFSLQMPQTVQATLPPANDEIRNLLQNSDPYGIEPHLQGVSRLAKKSAGTHYVTNPKDLEEVLKIADQTPVKTSKKVRTTPIISDKWGHIELTKPSSETKDTITGPSIRNVKRLDLKGTVSKVDPIVVNGDDDLVLRKPIETFTAALPKSFYMGTSILPPSPKTPNNNTSKNSSGGGGDVEVFHDVENNDKSPQKQTTTVAVEKELEPAKSAAPPTVQTNTSESCGVICTRPEYYTIPPTNELSNYKNADGTCYIKGFTIGRIGYGNVHFPDIMDVSNLNIDELVHFRYREMCIYLDDDKKPPVGEGLNRRAQVTLDRVFPKKQGNEHEFETDAQKLVDNLYPEILKEACLKAGTDFVDYRPETGSWVFNVQHFSKYGLTYEKENEYRKEVSQRSIAAPDEQETHLQAIEESESLLQQIYDRDEMYDYTITSVTDPIVDINIGTPPALFGRKNAATYLEKMSLLFSPDKDVEMEAPPEPLRLLAHVAPPAPPVRKIQRHVYKLKNQTMQVPLEVSVLPTKSVMDAAMMKGRSFKPRWGAGFSLTTLACGDAGDGAKARSLFVVDVGRICKVDAGRFEDAGMLESLMEVVLGETTLEPLNVRIEKGNNLLHQLDSFWKSASDASGDRRLRYVASLFDLCAVLWGPVDEQDVTRKQLLGDWLRLAARDFVSKDLARHKGAALKEVMSYLSGNQVAKAVDTALAANCPQLAMLLSQVNSNITKQYVQLQVAKWSESESTANMKTELLKLYLVCAGVPFYNSLNVCEDMDWVRSLAVHFWYVCESTDSINYVLAVYERAFGELGYAAKPHPLFSSSKDTWDILYCTIKLFCSSSSKVDEVLSPTTHTNDSLDYRLSWLLLQTFKSLDVGYISQAAEYHVTTMFANQLESAGLYKWAVYVLLFLPDVNYKRNAIQGLLIRNVTDDVDLERALIKQLLVPAEWIHAIKAERAERLGLYWHSARHHVHGRNWQRSHDVLVKHIVPELACNGHYDYVRRLLDELEPHADDVPLWDDRGGLLLEFARLYSSSSERPMTDQKAARLCEQLDRFIRRIKRYPTDDDRSQSFVVAEFSKFALNLFGEFIAHADGIDNERRVRIALHHTEKLDMPADYKYEKVFKIYKDFYY